jgi:hypothetical protein
MTKRYEAKPRRDEVTWHAYMGRMPRHDADADEPPDPLEASDPISREVAATAVCNSCFAPSSCNYCEHR